MIGLIVNVTVFVGLASSASGLSALSLIMVANSGCRAVKANADQ
jgi:hypothetical protein